MKPNRFVTFIHFFFFFCFPDLLSHCVKHCKTPFEKGISDFQKAWLFVTKYLKFLTIATVQILAGLILDIS
jgi:hypothetical protein